MSPCVHTPGDASSAWRTQLRSVSPVTPTSAATAAYVRFPPAARYSATASFLNSAGYGDFRPTRTPFLGSARSIVRVSTPPGSPHRERPAVLLRQLRQQALDELREHHPRLRPVEEVPQRAGQLHQFVMPLGHQLSRHIQHHARSTTAHGPRHKISGCSARRATSLLTRAANLKEPVDKRGRVAPRMRVATERPLDRYTMRSRRADQVDVWMPTLLDRDNPTSRNRDGGAE